MKLQDQAIKKFFEMKATILEKQRDIIVKAYLNNKKTYTSDEVSNMLNDIISKSWLDTKEGE